MDVGGWGSRGRASIGLGRLLDEFVGRRESGGQQEAVQADEACWIASQGWLWRGLVEAETTADLEELSRACDEQARDRQDAGRGWAADVWAAVAALVRPSGR